MATVIQHLETRREYVLLGTGFGMFKAQKPSFIFGNLLPDTDADSVEAVCVCDAKGEIQWFLAKEVQVVQVDGQSPAQILL